MEQKLVYKWCRTLALYFCKPKNRIIIMIITTMYKSTIDIFYQKCRISIFYVLALRLRSACTHSGLHLLPYHITLIVFRWTHDG